LIAAVVVDEKIPFAKLRAFGRMTPWTEITLLAKRRKEFEAW